MFAGPLILQIIALMDMLLAISICCYIGFRLPQGALLIPGNISETEKLSRLVIYISLLLIFLGIQLYMAVRLMRTTRWIFEQPLQSMKDISDWLEWSFVSLLFLVIHGATALLLMPRGERKLINMGLIGLQIIFRSVGLLVVAKHHHVLPPVPMKV